MISSASSVTASVVRITCASLVLSLLFNHPGFAEEQGEQLTPVGPEFQVNTHTPDSQFQARVSRHDSGFVVVWTSRSSAGTDSLLSSIQARRMMLDGTFLGDQFQVNTYTPGSQFQPSIASWPDGRFLVAWEGSQSPNLSAQLYHSDGMANGGEFSLSSYVTGSQGSPSLLVTSTGEVIGVWQSSGSPGTDDGQAILARRFDSNASPLGDDFQVNVLTTQSQGRPDIAEAPDGSFVVVWSSYASTGDDPEYSIQMRRLASDGTPVAADLQVNSYTSGYSYSPKVDVSEDGSFVVVWDSYYAAPAGDNDYGGVVARRFGSDGLPIAEDFQVNSYGTGYQYSSDVAVAPGGGFLIYWSGNAPLSADTDAAAALVSRYDSAGTLVGGELVVNSLTTDYQNADGLAMDEKGDFLVLWNSQVSAGDDTANTSIQGRFFVTEADIAVTKSDGVSVAVPGTQVTYTITVTNNGPDTATGVEVIDTLAKSLDCTYTSIGANGASGNSDSGSGDLTETGLILPPTAEVTYTLICDVAPDATGNLINTVGIAADQIDDVTGNDSATDMDALEPATDLSALLSANQLVVFPGHTVVLNGGVANDGPSTASGGTMTIPLPVGLSFVSSPVCTEDAGTVSCVFGSLPPMASGGISFTLLVDGGVADGTMLPLTETVTGNEPDGNGANDSDSITLTVAVPLFADGFESGDTTAWSSAVP